jgi:phosphoribosylformimino-5-aminoimidazole carboxamide ribonucleotide (ProFAR) isomerase
LRAWLVTGLPTACPADFDNDGFITGIDFDLFVAAFEAGVMTSDFDRDGFITGLDFDLFVQAFEAGC